MPDAAKRGRDRKKLERTREIGNSPHTVGLSHKSCLSRRSGRNRTAEAARRKIAMILFELRFHILACVITGGVIGLIHRLADLLETIHHSLEDGLELEAVVPNVVV